MKHLVGLVAMGALVTACATTTPDPTPDPVDPDAPTCAADDLKHLVGQSIGEIDVDSLPQPTRVVPHGMSITMEYRGDRTTLWLDPDARVERVICG